MHSMTESRVNRLSGYGLKTDGVMHSMHRTGLRTVGLPTLLVLYPRYKIWLVDCGVHYREYCGVQYRECAQDQMVYVDDLRLIPLGRTVYPDDAKLWPHLGRGP